jgi:hypothetical protein
MGRVEKVKLDTHWEQAVGIYSIYDDIGFFNKRRHDMV